MSRAIFLGSFNPPHKGHVDCIQSVVDSGIMKELNIDKIHVIPCWQNPNKNKFTVPFIKRYQMVWYMFGDLIRDGIVCPDDIENHIYPNYTCTLIDYFNTGRDAYINKNFEGFWWIITIETIKELMEQKWKCSKELLYDNNFIVVGKDEEEWNNLLNQFVDYKSIICAKFVKLNSTHDFHSTKLREKIKNGESIEDETCFWVNDYIKEMNLYKE